MTEKIRRLWPNLLIIFLFSACTVAQFWPALNGTVSLSKVQQLAEWDSLFAAQKSGQSLLMDPSLVYLMVPYYLLKASAIHSGQLPLWNQYSGLGCPLAADPQALAFSPLHLPLIISPGLIAYNQVLVMEIIVLGLSTFALARSLRLGLFASSFAMVALAFCPYERWYLELLGNGFCFVPLVFWLILRLRSRITAGKVWLTGFGCAMMVLSAHPELSFFSIGLASLALLSFVLFDFDRGADEHGQEHGLGFGQEQEHGHGQEHGFGFELGGCGYNKRLIQACLGLTAAGAIAFMLAGPMLLPFIEYLRNSDSYKFGSGAPAVVRWQTWLFDLLQPGYGGASPTLGPCALLLIPLAFSAAKSKKTMVGVLTAITILGLALTGKVFPLNMLLANPPFSYLVVTYAFPPVILMTVLLAAYGLHTALRSANGTSGKVAEDTGKLGRLPLCLSLGFALLVVAFPLAARALQLSLNSANFDMCLPDYAFNRNDVLRYSVFAMLAGASVLAIKLKPVRKTAIFLIAAICLGQSAEIITAAKSMPTRAPFKYQENTVVPELKANTAGGAERFIATGSHLFRPNSNVVFGLSDLRTHNPLFPKRYLTYIKACGAHLDEFNQEFDSPLSPLLALASVRTILSQSPVISKGELAANALLEQSTASKKAQTAGLAIEQGTEQKTAQKTLIVEPEAGIRACFTPTILDKQKRAVFGYLTIEAAPKRAAELSYNLALYDTCGHVLWFSDARTLSEDLKNTKFVSIPTPVAAPRQTAAAGAEPGAVAVSEPRATSGPGAVSGPRAPSGPGAASGRGPAPGPESNKSFLLGLQIYDNSAGKWLSPALGTLPFPSPNIGTGAGADTSKKPDPNTNNSVGAGSITGTSTASSPKIDNGRNIRLKDVFVFCRIDFNNSPANIPAPDYKLVFESTSRLRIYENVRALSRAYAVHQSLTVRNGEEALAAIQDISFDPSQTVVLESPAHAQHNGQEQRKQITIVKSVSSAGLETALFKTDTIKIATLTANQVTIDAVLQQPGIVVLNDIYYPGWQCQVDGKPTAIMRANYLMRAVEVPSGKHRIAFMFRPESFTWGIVLLVSALLVGLGIAIGAYRKAKGDDSMKCT